MLHTRTVQVASSSNLTKSSFVKMADEKTTIGTNGNHAGYGTNEQEESLQQQAVPAHVIDHKRYIHLDISGGSNNFGSSITPSASGGKGGTSKARLKHIAATQTNAAAKWNHKEPDHHLCHTCNPHTSQAFVDNYISTTKYNIFSFIPKNLFEQFQKKANFYFLLVAIVSLTPLSPKTPIVSVAPLVLVLAVSAIKEAIEDFQRYKLDKKINASLIDTWRHNHLHHRNGHGFESIKWKDLMVGDLVFVREGQSFPADIILLQSSGEQGLAHIETANLDGETNLKTKQAVPECWRIKAQDHSWGSASDRALALPPPPSAPTSARNNVASSKASAEALLTEDALSSRSNHPKSARAEAGGLKWPLKLPPFIIESSAPSRKLDGSAWKGNMQFLAAAPSVAPEEGEDVQKVSIVSDANKVNGEDATNEKIALGMTQLLLRGCVLRNTKWIIGVVMFTGVETKLMLNNRPAKLKRSHVDSIVDQSLYILFTIEFILCSLGAIANYVWLKKVGNTLPYLPDSSNLQTEAGLSWFTYLVLLDILIPISLYVSMELVKFAQAYLINKDIEMYHPETNTPAQARTSNLNEELGQVSYIFSDKTGTLTCNVMNFKACSVDGKIYGMGSTNNHTNSSADPEQHYEPYSIPTFKGIPPIDPEFPFKDTNLVRSLLNGHNARGNISLIDQFLTLLATCHTVLPDFPGCMKDHIHIYEENCKFGVEYQAASPDEKALTIAAKNNQYYFYHREPAQITVGNGANGVVSLVTPAHDAELSTVASSSAHLHHAPMQVNGEKMLVNILGQSYTFLILDAFEFTSERARMSVILIDPRDGLIKVFTKGSDTKMYKLLSSASKSSDIWKVQEEALTTFSAFGLRTLITGYKVLSENEYLEWAAKYARAKSAIENRESLVAECQNEIEQGLTLLGATAIEDRLQDGVPETIQKLSEAGIKIWVLTGDKVETAINIARSCSLVTPKMDETGLIELIVDDKVSEEIGLRLTKDHLDVAEAKVKRVAGSLPEGESSDALAIVVSGQALTHIFSIVRDAKGREILYENLTPEQKTSADLLRTQFLNICKRCRAVVCCRVSPNQKAEVVSLVKTTFPDKITLAIGDGANDVSMIKAAHVGIGISGLEGLQATMASDYSIAQFRFLEKLLLIHGHWSYERISKLILYSFYKNITIAMTSIWFAIYSGFSAQLFYDPYAGSVYNIIFTSIPVMLVAVFDREVSKKNLIKYPRLYATGLNNDCFNVKLLVRIILEGIAHSIVLYFGCLLMFNGGGDVVRENGQTHDLWVFSTAMYSYLVVVVNARIALDTTTFTWVHHLFLFLSVLAWFVFIIIYCSINVTPNMWYVAQYLFQSAVYWLGFGVIPAICIVPEVAWLAFRRLYRPTEKDIVMEIERGYGDHDPATSVVLVRAQSPVVLGQRNNSAMNGTGHEELHSRNNNTQHHSIPCSTPPLRPVGSGSIRRPSNANAPLVVQVSGRAHVEEESHQPPSARKLFPDVPITPGRPSHLRGGSGENIHHQPHPSPSGALAASSSNHTHVGGSTGGSTGAAPLTRPGTLTPDGRRKSHLPQESGMVVKRD